MNKPMKKYINGTLNLGYLSNNRQNINQKINTNNSQIGMINKKASEKKIHDSRLDKGRDKSKRDLNDQKVQRAKELLDIKETSNRKSDTFDNYNPEYRRKHEIRDFKEKSSNKVVMNYDDIFRDL